MSQLSIWEVRWAIPAAVIHAAEKIGNGRTRLTRIFSGLEVLAQRSKTSWIKQLSKNLLLDPYRVEDIVESGIQPDRELVERILNSF